MKNNNLTTICLCLIMALSFTTFAQISTPQGSQKATVTQRVGISDVSITYSRPSVNEREIWGKLVPFGMNNLGFGTSTAAPWRAGANENTTITFTHDATVEGKPIKAGTYGLHIEVKDVDNATIILSNDSDSWGSYFYDKKYDALRADVSIKDASHTELLTYVFNTVTATTATASLLWEKKEISFNIEFAVTDIVLTDFRQKSKGQLGFTRQNWEQAANFALNNGGDLNEALGWINNAISGQFYSQQDFNNTNIKANILKQLNKQKDALALLESFLPQATILETHQIGRTLIGFGLNDKALDVFKANAEKNANTWPVDYGLARAYSAKGDYKKALKHLEIALTRAPNPPNKAAVQANIDKLEKGEDIN